MTQNLPQLTPEAQAKMNELQSKLDDFKKRLLDKFDANVSGIALLPPGKTITQILESQEQVQNPDEKIDTTKINVFVLFDDTDSTQMSKVELKEKLTKHVEEMAKSVDENFVPQTMIYSELWQYCFDSRYEVLQILASSAPVHDNGMLAALKIAEVHKVMVLKKFEKYIVSYVLAGSLVQGRARPDSDVDVFIVIDDTDVKKMTRYELKDKLRSIIIGMGSQASELTGIKKAFNIQVYILTDFWDSIKEANPVIFTFLRDGVPLFDRGIFMPWKQLLKMGKVKPSMEAIEMYMGTGEQMLERTKIKINELGMEDTYYSILYPSQAAIMLYGLPPPAPKETPDVLRKIFVKKEKMLEEKYVKILEHNIKVRKELEHGQKKTLSGAELDQIMNDAQDFLQRVKKLYADIEEKQKGQNLVKMYDHVVTIMRDLLKMEGLQKVSDQKIVAQFEEHVVHHGIVPQTVVRMIEQLAGAKKQFEAGELHKAEIEKIHIDAQELMRALIDAVQAKRGADLERVKIRVKSDETFGEVILLDDVAYIIHDIDAPTKQVTRALVTKKGGLSDTQLSTVEELEKDLAQKQIPKRSFIKDQLFVDLKKIFGKDVEILLKN